MVSAASTPASCVICLLLAITAVSGQQPNPAAGAEPFLPVEQTWLVALPSPPAAGGAMDGERVYVPQADGQFVALDRQTGERVWSRALDVTQAPAAAGATVFAGGRTMLVALAAASGEPRWELALPRPLAASPVFDTGWLIVCLEGGDVLGLDARDGREVWRQSLGSAVRGVPVPGQGQSLYVATADGRLLALALVSGQRIWEQAVPGIPSPPAWAPDRVYVGSDDNHLYAFDATSGRLAWKWRAGGDVIGASVDGNLVVFASLDNVVRGVNRGNGNQQWRTETTTRPTRMPVAFGGLALVPGVSPTLSGFAARNGSATGTYTAPGAVEGAPLVDPVLKPFRVAAVIVMRDGQVAGLRPTALLFRDEPAAPLAALPGRALARDAPARP